MKIFKFKIFRVSLAISDCMFLSHLCITYHLFFNMSTVSLDSTLSTVKWGLTHVHLVSAWNAKCNLCTLSAIICLCLDSVDEGIAKYGHPSLFVSLYLNRIIISFKVNLFTGVCYSASFFFIILYSEYCKSFNRFWLRSFHFLLDQYFPLHF